jgi:hypothetical protein
MMSILSNGGQNIKNTISLKLGHAITTTEGQTATVIIDENAEYQANTNLEEIHYLMV